MAKVSVIIPVYNKKKHLKECLNSVINQTLKDIEIICIDDGSTDGSSDIIKEFAQKDNRIVIIDKQNSGVAAARNDGIEKASSEYLMFLDGDDYFLPTACEIAYNAVSSEFDVGIFGHKIKKRRNPIPTIIANPNTYMGYINIWNKIFRKTFLKENNIIFPVGIITAEDIIFSYEVYFHNPKITFINEHLMVYRTGKKPVGAYINEINTDLKAVEYFFNKDIYKIQSVDNKCKVVDMFSSIIGWLATKAKTKKEQEYVKSLLNKYCSIVETDLSQEDLQHLLSYQTCKNPVFKTNLLAFLTFWK